MDGGDLRSQVGLELHGRAAVQQRFHHADMDGDLLISEPVGRLIRRAKVTNRNGKITLENAYKKAEFITSTDMNFRVVNMYTGPDGCLYLLDMNRGIIQEGNWTKADSYLRPQITRLGLDKNIQHGRIYRLVHDGMERGPKPHLLDESSAKLVSYLGHPNGWWRDNAQKELIVRNDKSVVPALKTIADVQSSAAANDATVLARLHALWTLEGLDALDKKQVLNALKDKNIQIRKAAVILSETYIRKQEEDIIVRLSEIKADPSPEVRMQLVLSLSYSKLPKAKALVNELLSAPNQNEVVARAQKSVEKNEEVKKFGLKLGRLDAADRELVMEGALIYRSLCTTCHGPDGKGIVSKTAPPLVGSKRLTKNSDASVRILLHGLAGPIEGQTYPAEMPAMKDNDDEWIASVASYVRHEFSNAPPIRPAFVKMIREETVNRNKAYTMEELTSKVP